MPVLVRIDVPAPDDILAGYGVGALLRLERAASQAGTYAEIDTEAIVASTFNYEVWDDAGSLSSWYRTRYSNAAGTLTSEYSDPFTPAAPESYATLEDLFRVAGKPSERSTEKVVRMEQALVDATAMLTQELDGRDYFRHPRTGTESWIVDAPGGDLLHAHDGIAELASVEIRDAMSSDWTLVDASDWLLEPDLPPDGEPWFHLRLTGVVARATWPYGSRLIRLTGARGWPRPPATAVKANVDWARMAIAADPNAAGGPVGPPELGRPIGAIPMRLPDSVWRLKRADVTRFLDCDL